MKYNVFPLFPACVHVIEGENIAQEQLVNWNEDKTKTNFDFKDTVVQSIMRYNQLFTVKTDITIPGDFSLRAGDIIQCDFPRVSGDTKDKQT